MPVSRPPGRPASILADMPCWPASPGPACGSRPVAVSTHWAWGEQAQHPWRCGGGAVGGGGRAAPSRKRALLLLLLPLLLLVAAYGSRAAAVTTAPHHTQRSQQPHCAPPPPSLPLQTRCPPFGRCTPPTGSPCLSRSSTSAPSHSTSQTPGGCRPAGVERVAGGGKKGGPWVRWAWRHLSLR